MTKFANEIFYTALHLDIIEELGEVYAWELSYKLSGRRFYIPKNKPIETHPQLSILSRELAEFLQSRYTGERLIIPLGSNNEYRRRKIQGVSMFNNGDGCNDIASRLRVSYSTARRYKKYASRNNNQGELF